MYKLEDTIHSVNVSETKTIFMERQHSTKNRKDKMNMSWVAL